MAWFTPSSRFTPLVLAVALTLGLGVNVPAQVKAQSTLPSLGRVLESAFRAPRTDTPAPENRQGGATRDVCVNSEKFAALVPVFGVGNTTAEYPTIYWYMPELRADKAESPVVKFELQDANKQVVYSAEYPLEKSGGGIVGTPGLMSLRVTNLYPLKTNQEYHWAITLRCDSTSIDNSNNMTVEGAIKRVEADPTLAQRLQRATPQERVAIYAKAQLWYEALGTLAELRRDRPNDPVLADAWTQLLDSVKLDTISREPLYQGVRNLTSNNQ
ncbi:MAG: DUF928 domain-containing protein [Cyanobacteriota bacterium]|nr:DUF928 domain-containing protein [Cyanobacteriota bacterium]